MTRRKKPRNTMAGDICIAIVGFGLLQFALAAVVMLIVAVAPGPDITPLLAGGVFAYYAYPICDVAYAAAAIWTIARRH